MNEWGAPNASNHLWAVGRYGARCAACIRIRRAKSASSYALFFVPFLIQNSLFYQWVAIIGQYAINSSMQWGKQWITTPDGIAYDGFKNE